jgi:hypothetical protein
MSNEHTDQTPVVQLDHSKRYTCPELKGFAVYVRGWEKTYECARFLWTDPESGESFEVEDAHEGEWVEDPNTGRVRVVCVGDDKEHLVEYSSLTELGERDYCHACGQVGCKHDGRDDDPEPDPDEWALLDDFACGPNEGWRFTLMHGQGEAGSLTWYPREERAVWDFWPGHFPERGDVTSKLLAVAQGMLKRATAQHYSEQAEQAQAWLGQQGNSSEDNT